MTRNEEIGARLKDRRIELNLTLQNVAESLGVAISTIQRYEAGTIGKIKLPVINAISEKLGLNPAWVCGKSDVRISESDVLPSNLIPMTEIPRIPVVGRIAAGMPILAVENIIGFEYVPELSRPEECFCLIVQGDSMINAGIKDGARVVIRLQPTADDGQIVVCIVNGDEATLKRFKRVDDNIILMPENPKYKPIIVSAAEFECGYARIVGVAEFVLSVTRL